MHWPDRITDAGALREQFHHVVDIAPTVYEATGVAPPDVYNGHEQIPIAGTPMMYAVDEPEASTTRAAQYFEMGGHRGMVEDGWKAVTRRDRFTDVPIEEDAWELYHLTEDFSECNDLAAEHPDKVEHLVSRWWEEMEHHGGLPFDTRGFELFASPPSPTHAAPERPLPLPPSHQPHPRRCGRGHGGSFVDDDREGHPRAGRERGAVHQRHPERGLFVLREG